MMDSFPSTTILSPSSSPASCCCHHRCSFLCNETSSHLMSSPSSSLYLSFVSWNCSCLMPKRSILIVFLLVMLDLASSSPLIPTASPPSSSALSSKIDCLIDSKKGFSNSANVYQCSPSQRCCFEYAKPSCCGSKPTTLIL